MRRVQEVVVYTTENNEHEFKVQAPFYIVEHTDTSGRRLTLTDVNDVTAYFNWDKVIAVEVHPWKEIQE